MSCPICAKPGEAGYRPFCSRRCADIDLARWLGETYRTPAQDFDPVALHEALDAQNQQKS